MSDFLTALAISALGLPAAVEPRRRSRFEEPLATPWGEEKVEIEAPAPRVRETERPPPPATIEPAPPPEAAGAAPTPDAAPISEPAAQAPEQTAKPATVIHRVRAVESPPRPATEPRPAPAASPNRLEPAAERGAARDVKPTRVVRATDAAAHRDAPPPPTAPPPAIAAREPPASSVVVPDIVEPARAALPRTVPAPPALTASRPAQPPPMVQVTIGRIEVRAVPPSAAPAQPQQPAAKFAPTLPLADYLARRNRSGM